MFGGQQYVPCTRSVLSRVWGGLPGGGGREGGMILLGLEGGGQVEK